MFDEKLLFDAFLTEGLEQVAMMEEGLLHLEAAPGDQETVHALYRAAHTLKGGCFVIGCNDLGNFCHQVEETFGSLRCREMAVDSTLITTLLRVADFLKTSLAVLASGEPFTAENGTALLADLARLNRLLPQERPVAAESTAAPPEVSATNRISDGSSPAAPRKGSKSGTIRIEQNKIENLLNNVGELIIVHSMLRQSLSTLFPDSQWDSRLGGAFDQMQRLGRDVQENAMSLRMQPVAEVFRRCERTVRDLAASTGKKVVLHEEGGNTELDKGMLEKLVDPLMHLLRNAIDHGLEPEGERLARGKPPVGVISLKAEQRGGAVFIELQDDGRGLDRTAIIATARRQGLLGADEEPGDNEVFDLVFRPGFSTAAAVSEISGRGVGMDVVRRNIELLQGSVQLTTVPGRGTTVTIKLPLTMAILDGLVVQVGTECYIIPLGYVLESLRPAQETLQTVNGTGEIIFVRGEWLPVVRLHRRLGISAACENACHGIMVILECGIRRCALLVDEVSGQQQVVLKNLGAATPQIPGIIGGTILGDGRVALVIDVSGLIATSLS